MKTKKRYPRYPNAADRDYYIRKLLDAALILVTSLGAFVTMVFFLLL